MSVRSAQAITVEFTTRVFSTGVATNADSLPVGTLVVNGTDNGASVTVTNVDTGRYKAAVTLPTLAVGDIVELSIAATVSSIADKAIVWRDTKDVLLDTSGKTTDSVQTGDSFARIGAAGVSLSAIPDEAGITTLLARLTATRAGYLDNLSGGAVALASGVTVIAAGLNAVLVDGKALPAALQIIAASVAGKISGAGTGTETFLGLDQSTTRFVSTVDASGNRSGVSYP